MEGATCSLCAPDGMPFIIIIIIIRTSAFTSTVSPRIRMCPKTDRVGREENKNK